MRLVPRVVKAPTFTAGARETVELRVDRIVHHWVLALGFTWNVAGGTGAGSFHSDPQARALREWVLNGNNKPLVKMGGGALYLYTLLFLREMFTNIPPDNLAAGAAQTGRELAIYLPAAMGHALPGQEETFGLPPVANPSMEFLFGDASDLALGADGAATYSAQTSRLVEWSYDNPRVPAVMRNGKRVPVGFAPFMARTQTQAVNGTEDLTFKLDEVAAGYELRAIIIEAQSGGAAGGADYVYDDDVVTEVSEFVINDDEKYKPVRFRDVQQENKRNYQLADLQTGCAVIDAAADMNIARGELWTHGTRSVPYIKLACEKQGAELNRVSVTSIYTAR